VPRTDHRPLPPAPAPGELCAWGCSPSVGWRWYSRARTWERVCRTHTGAPATLTRREYVPDDAIVMRGGSR
jgi:hypothetical protein